MRKMELITTDQSLERAMREQCRSVDFVELISDETPWDAKSVLVISDQSIPPETLKTLEGFPDPTFYLISHRYFAEVQAIREICREKRIIPILPGRGTDQIVRLVRRHIEPELMEPVGRVVTIGRTSPKAGATTTAFHLAAVMARENQVIYLDLNPVSAALESWLLRQVNYRLSKMVDRLRTKQLDRSYLQKVVQTVHGVDVVPGNDLYLLARRYQLEDIDHLIRTAAEHYDLVVCDIGDPDTAIAKAALTAADQVGWVTTADAHALEDGRRWQPALDQLLGIEPQLVLNRGQKAEIARVKDELGLPVAVLPEADIPVESGDLCRDEPYAQALEHFSRQWFASTSLVVPATSGHKRKWRWPLWKKPLKA